MPSVVVLPTGLSSGVVSGGTAITGIACCAIAAGPASSAAARNCTMRFITRSSRSC